MFARSIVWCALLLIVAAMSGPRAHGADVGDEGKTPIHRAAVDVPASGHARPAGSAGTTLVLLGLLLAGAIVGRRIVQQRAGKRSSRQSQTAIRLMGRHQIDPELNVRLLQVGSRLLVVAATPQGVATLAEITDPQEIALLTGETVAANGSLFTGSANIATPTEPSTPTNCEVTPPVADRHGTSRIQHALQVGGSR